MKLFTNLPGNLRTLFGIFRLLTVVLAAFWLLSLTFHTWVQARFTDSPRLMLAIGEVHLRANAHEVGMTSDIDPKAAMEIGSLHGQLSANLASQDPALVNALRWTLFPSIAVFLLFYWLLFGALRDVCAHIEKGEVFSVRNLSVVKCIGMTLIGYGIFGALNGLWAGHVMGNYLSEHTVFTGLSLAPSSVTPRIGFMTTSGILSYQGAIIIGCVVLVITEVFRQGLALKTENELTV